MKPNKVIVLTGPTGVGKTLLSTSIAKHFHLDIINGDAYQVYQKMNIGTAKPTIEEQKGIKHDLLDFLDPQVSYSVSDYQKNVRTLIDQNDVSLIVGGSGLYIDSVIREYDYSGERRKSDSELDNKTNEELHEILVNLNPTIASTIPTNNRKRVLRAIELINTGEIESRTRKNEFHYHSLVIFLTNERPLLYERINKRVDQMVNDGLFEEVKSLYPNFLGPTAIKAIGYKEVIDYLNHQVTKEEAIEKIKQNSRHYAKRQITWYKAKPETKFINVDYDNINNTINDIINLINEFLQTNNVECDAYLEIK